MRKGELKIYLTAETLERLHATIPTGERSRFVEEAIAQALGLQPQPQPGHLAAIADSLAAIAASLNAGTPLPAPAPAMEEDTAAAARLLGIFDE